MGMFTSIIDSGNIELHIKCGYDDCDVYHIGDKVDFQIWPNFPGTGKLLDGVYDSDSPIENSGPFVIIKDHIVALIIPRGNGVTATGLEKDYGIVPYQHDWWAEEVWLKDDLRRARIELENIRWFLKLKEEEIDFLKTLEGLNAEEIKDSRHCFHINRLCNTFENFLIGELTNESFSRKIFMREQGDKSAKTE